MGRIGAITIALMKSACPQIFGINVFIHILLYAVYRK
ncbi:MAG: hypothetical protein KatS3mg058_4110 [Roseiflexus sp.]|nr:MAG: hypothetical protein KatS3mg058_4110 [Roseiflexus sp.]